MSSHPLTASLAAAHIDTLLAQARQDRLAREARRTSRPQKHDTSGERPRRRWLPRLATA